MAKRKDYVGIHKANKKITGAVAQFKMGQDRTCMFLELAKQHKPMDDPAPFDWENTKICVKLGIGDIGKMLSLLNGNLPLQEDARKPDLDIYHRNQKGNKSIKLKKQDRGYYMKVGIQEGDRRDAIALPISWDEAELVRIALARGYEIILGW